MKRKALFIFLLLIIPLSSVSAHYPIWGDALGPIKIDSVSTSYAFYQTLQADEIDVFYFDGKQGDNFHAGIQIPDIAALKNYGVSIALFGRGFPQPEESQLPPEHPEDLGAVIYPSEVTEDFYEPITQANYWGRQELDLPLPADGAYYLIVWQPEGKPGKYVMDTGYAEEFGLLNFFLLPIWWVRVQIFHQYYARLVIVISAIVCAIGFSLYRRFKRRHHVN
jgi:hypothetical protein